MKTMYTDVYNCIANGEKYGFSLSIFIHNVVDVSILLCTLITYIHGMEIMPQPCRSRLERNVIISDEMLNILRNS